MSEFEEWRKSVLCQAPACMGEVVGNAPTPWGMFLTCREHYDLLMRSGEPYPDWVKTRGVGSSTVRSSADNPSHADGSPEG